MRYERTVKLKNGQSCMLRNAAEGDAQEVYDIFHLTHTQTDYLLTYPDESKMTVDGERAFLKEMEASENEIELCAAVDGKIVGTAGIQALGHMFKMQHRAEFGISVDRAYWGLGIGRALTEACIECAKTAGFAQLELTAVAENAAALSLYRSIGFTEFGRNPKGFLSRISGWQETVMMRMEL